MKKTALILMMALMGLTSFAQVEGTTEGTTETTAESPAANVVKFGYLSYDSVMQAMPEYAEMQMNMAQLRSQYEAEQQRVTDDFNTKYEEFLDGQRNFPKTILQKRQSELQEMLDKNIAFKKEGQRLLCKAEAEAKAPIQQKLANAVATIAQQRGYAFVLNTDANAAPWTNPAMGEDITEAVKEALK